jgi:hypothetical protein
MLLHGNRCSTASWQSKIIQRVDGWKSGGGHDAMWDNPTAALPKASNETADADMHACPAIWQDHHFATQLATSA